MILKEDLEYDLRIDQNLTIENGKIYGIKE